LEKLERHCRYNSHPPLLKAWRKLVLLEKLKGWDAPELPSTPLSSGSPQDPFTLDGFLMRLTKWAVVSDQVSLLFNTFNFPSHPHKSSQLMLSSAPNSAIFFSTSIRTYEMEIYLIGPKLHSLFLKALIGNSKNLLRRFR